MTAVDKFPKEAQKPIPHLRVDMAMILQAGQDGLENCQHRQDVVAVIEKNASALPIGFSVSG
jgi:hypothetical protein